LKKSILHIVLTVFTITIWAKTVKNHNVAAPFNISIVQGGVAVSVVNNEITLSKSPFDIVIDMPKPDGVLLNASTNKKTATLALKNRPQAKLPGFKETGMAEALLNPDKEIILAETAPSFWYYDNENEHRFNSVIKSDNGLKCIRSVENLYDRKTKNTIKINDIKSKLYLVFIYNKPNTNYFDRIEEKREIIIINWKN
jgi:hypothetical protein